MKYKSTHKSIRTIASVVAGFLVFLIVLVISQNIISRAKQDEKVDVINRFIDFQHDIETIVYNNITLIDGYLAYIKADQTVSQEKTTIYLDFLISEQAHFIRNIGIIEDTTIVWNYPLEGNEPSIGVDLAQIDGQKDIILETKRTLEPVFQGPVQLVQGGIGFIVRLPLERDGKYWGQVSLVIDGEAFYNAIDESANKHNLEIALYNRADYPEESFYKTVLFEKYRALNFDLNADLIKWKVEVKPQNDWINYMFNYVIIFSLSICFALFTGLIVSKKLKGHEVVKFQANHDFLTGLYNRTYLEKYQEAMFKQAEIQEFKLAIMIMDINKFKSINDQYGHQVGDHVLKWVASVLQKSAGINDGVFRLGGDEFLIAFPQLEDEKQLDVVYRNINRLLDEHFFVINQMIEVSMSIGYAVYPIDGEDIDDLIKVADKGMYEMKAQSRK